MTWFVFRVGRKDRSFLGNVHANIKFILFILFFILHLLRLVMDCLLFMLLFNLSALSPDYNLFRLWHPLNVVINLLGGHLRQKWNNFFSSWDIDGSCATFVILREVEPWRYCILAITCTCWLAQASL